MQLSLPVALFALASSLCAQSQFADLAKRHLPLDRPDVHGTHSVALGDVDGDDDMDVVIADQPGPIRVWVNDGQAVFVDESATRVPTVSGIGIAVALGDIDGDGDLDLVLGKDGGQDELYRNDGTGHFTDATAGNLPPAPDPDGATAGLAFADVDEDGDLDLALAGRGTSAQTRLYLNDGSGGFTDVTRTHLPADNAWSYAIAFVDVDGDRDADLVVGNWLSAPDHLYLNDGTGRFTDETSSRLPVDGDTTLAVGVGDVDGDGDQDLVLANVQGQDRLYVNDGSGTFRDVTAGNLPSHMDVSASVALADVDGDGDVDLLFGTFAPLSPVDRLYLNDGRGTFTAAAATQLATSGYATTAVALADLDDDGDADALLLRRPNDRNELWLNDGAGSFVNGSQADMTPSDGASGVALADVDGDGDQDAVLAVANGPDRLWINDGRGSFRDETAARMPAVSLSSSSVVAGDVDGDGDIDLVFGDQNPFRPDRLYVNDGSGIFAEASAAMLPANLLRTACLALGDVDRDGDLDLVLGVWPTNGQTRLYRNDGVFLDVTAQHLPPDDEATTDMVLEDLDGDGHLDLVLANGPQPMRFYRNDGTGRFVDETAGRIPFRSGRMPAVAAGDVDGDGDLDLVLAINELAPDRLLLNDGAGFFADAPAGMLPDLLTRTGDVALCDVDEDGDLDLLSIKGAFQDGSVLCVNDGSGRFVASDRVPAEVGFQVAFGDIDGDRDMDLVTSAQQVFRNVRRQLTTPHVIRIGGDFRLDAFARHGPFRWADIAFPFVSDASASLVIEPLGTLGIHPMRAVALPPALIPSAEGVVSMHIAVPSDPLLVGATLHAQMVLGHLPDVYRLSNVTLDVVTDV